MSGPNRRSKLTMKSTADRPTPTLSSVTILSGDGEVGKGLLILQLAIAVAAAKEWIGLMPEQFGPALYFVAEDDEDELHRRTHDICAGLGGFAFPDDPQIVPVDDDEFGAVLAVAGKTPGLIDA